MGGGTRTNAQSLALASGVGVALLGAVMLVAWLLGGVAPVRFAATMKPNSALGFILAGGALCAGASGAAARSRAAGVAMAGGAAAVAALGGVTLLEYLLGWEVGIDRLLYQPPDSVPTAFPTRMEPMSAVSFVLAGSALTWEAAGRRDPRAAHALALGVALLSFVALIGYAYELRPIYGVEAYRRMAVHTALAFSVLSAGILLLRPDIGVMGVITSDSAGGIMARRVLPATILVPVALGWLRLVGQRAGLYGNEFGSAVNVLGNVMLFTAVVVWTAASLHRTDRERRRAREAVAASERRYRQLAEASLDAIVVADGDGRITLFNAAAERAFGFAAAEVEGRPLTVLMPPEFHAQHERGFRRFLETREARLVGRTVEIVGRRKNGTQFPLELSLAAVELGRNIQFIGSIRDLTERHRMRAAMIQSEKLASIGLLSAGVAHEINNPLAYVANNLAVLERDARSLMAVVDAYEAAHDRLAAADPASAAHVRTVTAGMDLAYVRANLERVLASTREGVQRVVRIVQAMRGMARTGTPQMETVGLGDLVDMSLELVRGRIERRGIAVQLDCTAAPKLRGVSSQLAQVLLNLLVNAVQAVEASGRGEGGHIRVASRPLGEEVVIEVADNGCGIRAEDLPHVFDPFFTTKDVGEGTGLGLAISHGIVAAHGGRMEASSEPGKGSCFRIYLPLRDGGAP